MQRQHVTPNIGKPLVPSAVAVQICTSGSGYWPGSVCSSPMLALCTRWGNILKCSAVPFRVPLAWHGHKKAQH